MPYPQERFRETRFKSGSFWAEKRSRISRVAVFYQLEVLKKTDRYDAFRLEWKQIYGDAPEIWPVPKHLFWDSDVAKWIEGACYFLAEEENETVRAAVDELVDMIAAAQQPDGYLNIHFTVVDPKGRFTNLRDLHELYNAGHLIEAALAHEQLYGNSKLLDPILKYVDLIYETFGAAPHKKPGYPGHPEIELALLRLYERTQDSRHLELARFFVTERGNPTGVEGQHYYTFEAKARGESEHEVPDYFPAVRSYWYQQAHAPLTEQATVEGHSVRATYLLTALADLVRLENGAMDKSYTDTLYRLWNNMVQKKMYLTGGIGAMKQWEGFGQDYFLPQGSDEGGCYAETCASIGIIMLADRLLAIDRDGDFGDVMELALYNAVLTGVSCDGRAWTYVNQLASSDADLSQRADWFTVACCPPNVLRLLGDLGGYLFSAEVGERRLDVVITLFADAQIVQRVGSQEVKISMHTAWPLDGKIDFQVDCPSSVDLCLHVRVPKWAKANWKITPSPQNAVIQKGYMRLEPEFLRDNKSFSVEYPMEPVFISPHPHTGQEVVAVQRGPLVYCAEDVDNPWVDDHFKKTVVDHTAKLTEQRVRDEKTGEEYIKVTAVNAASQVSIPESWSSGPGRPLHELNKAGQSKHMTDIHFVPYYFRANRGGRGHMRVGLKWN